VQHLAEVSLDVAYASTAIVAYESTAIVATLGEAVKQEDSNGNDDSVNSTTCGM